MTMTRTLITSTIAALLLVACDPEDGTICRGERCDPPGEGETKTAPQTDPSATADPTQPGVCKEGVAHIGFDKTDFVLDRVVAASNENRLRVKPFSALTTEFRRVLGAAPAGMAASEAAYGGAPARWYNEPTAGAVSLYTTYSLAFSGCYDTMTDAKYAMAPTQATADAECAALQRKAWQRTATPDEVKACSDLAVNLTTETVARRRWAHACASIMTSTGLISY